MRIMEKNGIFSVSFGITDNAKEGDAGSAKRAGKERTSLFAGDFGQDHTKSAIEKKRQEIRQKATKVLMDRFEADQKRDESLEETKGKIDAAWEERKAVQDKIAELDEQIENSSEEQRNDPEREMELQKYRTQLSAELQQAENKIIAGNYSVRDAKLAKLGERYEGSMAWAADKEQEILDAGSDEIMGLAAQEGMQHIDELYQENIEKAQEQKEKKEEQEERLEALKEKKEQTQEQIENAKENAKENAVQEQKESVEEVNETVTEQAVDEELKKILQDSGLTDEELKGLLVDSSL